MENLSSVSYSLKLNDFISTGHGKAKSVEIGAPFSAAAAARILSQRPKASPVALPRPLLSMLGAHGRALRSGGDRGSGHGSRGQRRFGRRVHAQLLCGRGCAFEH